MVPQLDRARAAKDLLVRVFIDHPGISGIGLTQRAGEWIIKVNLTSAGRTIVLPAHIDGIIVTSDDIGPVSAQADTATDPDPAPLSGRDYARLARRLSDTPAGDERDALLAVWNECGRLQQCLTDEAEEYSALNNRMAELLSGVAVALNGPEPELTSWSWHDLPAKAQQAMAEKELNQNLLAALRTYWLVPVSSGSLFRGAPMTVLDQLEELFDADAAASLRAALVYPETDTVPGD